MASSIAGDPGDRRDDLIAVLPGVVSVVGAERLAADDLEALAELVLEFTLPLEGEVGRGDDQRPTDQAPSLEFLEQQPRHDRLARARVVGQEEADAGQLEEVVVDGLELVRQGIDAGDGEREVGVVLVGEPEPLGFDAEPEQASGRRRTIRARGEQRSWANCAGVRTGSRTSPVLQPLPISLMESPSGTTASTSTGSGRSGPVITEPTWISSTVMGSAPDRCGAYHSGVVIAPPPVWCDVRVRA